MPVVLWWVIGILCSVLMLFIILGILGVMNLSYPPTDNPRCYCPDCGADLGNFHSNRIRMVRRRVIKKICKDDLAAVNQFQDYLRDLCTNSGISDEEFADKWHEYMEVDKPSALEHRKWARENEKK